MGSAAGNNFIFLEPTFGRVLRIWRAWFWRFALLGGVPVVLAFSVNYYDRYLSKFSALEALVIVPFWAYAYTFRVLFEKNLSGVRIRLQPLSPAGSANQPQIFLIPTRRLIRKVRKKWTQRSWRWGLGFLVTMLLFGGYKADNWLKSAGPNSAETLIASFLIIVLFCGAPLGWLIGSAWELKTIFKEDFGEFRLCLTADP